MPYGLPVAGSQEEGPVEPKQPPRELTHTTKKRSVSMGLPGPTMYSHQPAVSSASLEAAWAVGDSPVKTRMALSWLRDRVPHVS